MKAIYGLGVGVGILALVGCASQPEELATQYVSPVQYQGLDCEQVSLEMFFNDTATTEIYTGLKKTADNDAAQMGVGLVLLWPTLFFLEGGDGPQAAEYSRLKGEYEALESVAVQKKCSVSTTAKIARWSAQAESAAKEACTTPPAPGKLIAATGDQEDYQFPCAGQAPVLVRCEADGCRALE
jgi:hypothetical protein